MTQENYVKTGYRFCAAETDPSQRRCSYPTQQISTKILNRIQPDIRNNNHSKAPYPNWSNNYYTGLRILLCIIWRRSRQPGRQLLWSATASYHHNAIQRYPDYHWRLECQSRYRLGIMEWHSWNGSHCRKFGLKWIKWQRGKTTGFVCTEQLVYYKCFLQEEKDSNKLDVWVPRRHNRTKLTTSWLTEDGKVLLYKWHGVFQVWMLVPTTKIISTC